jgi:hypothetical protein
MHKARLLHRTRQQRRFSRWWCGLARSKINAFQRLIVTSPLVDAFVSMQWSVSHGQAPSFRHTILTCSLDLRLELFWVRAQIRDLAAGSEYAAKFISDPSDSDSVRVRPILWQTCTRAYTLARYNASIFI